MTFKHLGQKPLSFKKWLEKVGGHSGSFPYCKDYPTYLATFRRGALLESKKQINIARCILNWNTEETREQTKARLMEIEDMLRVSAGESES